MALAGGKGMRSPEVTLTDSNTTATGLEKMLTAAIGEHGYHLPHVDLPIALLIIEIARRSEDVPEWFPRGRWAAVTSMQDRTERVLNALFPEKVKP
jgi:hypothetical protein